MNGTQIELIEQIYYDLISDEGASDSGNVILTFYYKCFEVKHLLSSGYMPLPPYKRLQAASTLPPFSIILHSPFTLLSLLPLWLNENPC